MIKEQQQIKEFEIFEDMRKQISDLKIAHTLKPSWAQRFLHSLENAEKPGLIYRTSCLCILLYAWFIQISAFYNGSSVVFSMLPLTVGLSVIALILINHLIIEDSLLLMNLEEGIGYKILLIWLTFLVATLFIGSNHTFPHKMVYIYVLFFPFAMCFNNIFLVYTKIIKESVFTRRKVFRVALVYFFMFVGCSLLSALFLGVIKRVHPDGFLYMLFLVFLFSASSFFFFLLSSLIFRVIRGVAILINNIYKGVKS